MKFNFKELLENSLTSSIVGKFLALLNVVEMLTGKKLLIIEKETADSAKDLLDAITKPKNHK